MEGDKRRVATLFFHFSVFFMYVYTIIYDTINHPEAPHRLTYAGRFKFLTFWNEVCIFAFRAGVKCHALQCGESTTCKMRGKCGDSPHILHELTSNDCGHVPRATLKRPLSRSNIVDNYSGRSAIYR